MVNFKKTVVTTAKAKIAEADAKAFQARSEAIEAILEGASPNDVMMLRARTPSRLSGEPLWRALPEHPLCDPGVE
jgi:hypothetical protein